MGAPDPSDGHALFEAHLPTIERVIALVCRRNHLDPDEGDEFASRARIRLLSDDCAALRAFAGRCSLQTYLSIVVKRYLVDYQRESWGKWRPCAEATRLGPTAVLLDRLTSRDGYSVDQAYEIMTTNHRIDVTRAEVEKMIAALPHRQPRRFEGDDTLVDRPADGASGDVIAEREAAESAPQVAAGLRRAFDALGSEDRLVLLMRFHDGRPVGEIASILGIEQRFLFRRIEKLLKGVRQQLEKDGIDKSLVLRVLESEQGAFELSRHLPGISGPSPSVVVRASEWQ